MDKCVLDGRDRRLRCMFEMAGWRCLRCLGKATADGVWPAVGHCQGVIGFRRDGDTLGISLDVARVKKGVSIEVFRVDGVLAAGGVICGECLDAGVKIMFVGGSKVVRVRSRVVGMGLVEVLVKSIA
jgi:hypothetical protein